jgi:spore coat polysaccharide biosynthesis protein SpsF (cytidylyltransferase family)
VKDSAAIVLQARVGSRRLPQKVLAPIGRRSMLSHCIVRLGDGRLPVIVATTERPEDDPVAEEAVRHGVSVVRGSEDDVLSRYLQAAATFGLREIVRATADNPFVDSGSAMRVLALCRRVHADHVVEHGLPLGAAVEAVTVDALRRAHRLVTDPYDREHVTSLIRRDARFRALRAVAPVNVRRPGLRLTVDTIDDLEFARAVHRSLGGGDVVYPLATIIRAADNWIIQSEAQRRSRV